MAIKVQYGGGQAGPAAGQIIAQAGQANLDREQQARMQGIAQQFQAAESAKRLEAARESQMAAIDAQADRDKSAADQAMKVTAIRSGLDEAVREQEYDREVQILQERAKAEAGKFKWEISAKDRGRLAKLSNSRSLWREELESGSVTQDVWQSGDDIIGRQIAGIEPTSSPADLNALKPPQEQMFTDPITKSLMGQDRAGNPRVLVPYKDTAEGIQQKAEIERKQKEIDAREKFEDALSLKTRKDAGTGQEVPISETEKRAIRRSRYGVEEVPYTTDERRDLVQSGLERKYPDAGYDENPLPQDFGSDIPTGGAPAQPADPQRTEAEAEAAMADSGQWWSAVEAEGVPVPERFRDLPPKIGTAKSVYSAYIEKFGSFENIPEKYQPAVAEMILAINEYEGN